MDICWWKDVLGWSNVIFGLAAAALWFAASTYFNASWLKDTFSRFDKKLASQSRYNAAAAFCAAVSAVSQIVVLKFPICRAFS
jgi:hypothetical protein